MSSFFAKEEDGGSVMARSTTSMIVGVSVAENKRVCRLCWGGWSFDPYEDGSRNADVVVDDDALVV